MYPYLCARVCVCVGEFERVLGACMLAGVGIRNRLRGKWTAGSREEGEEEGRKGSPVGCGVITVFLQSRPATSLFVGD